MRGRNPNLLDVDEVVVVARTFCSLVTRALIAVKKGSDESLSGAIVLANGIRGPRVQRSFELRMLTIDDGDEPIDLATHMAGNVLSSI